MEFHGVSVEVFYTGYHGGQLPVDKAFANCVVPENIHTPTTEDFLVCPPPTPKDFPFQGVFDDPPSPQEFPEFLNGDFTYHLLEIQSGFGT